MKNALVSIAIASAVVLGAAPASAADVTIPVVPRLPRIIICYPRPGGVLPPWIRLRQPRAFDVTRR